MAADQQADRPQRQCGQAGHRQQLQHLRGLQVHAAQHARHADQQRGHQQREHHRHRQPCQQRCRRRHRQRALEGQQAAFAVQRELHAEAEQGRRHRAEHAVGGQQVQRRMAPPQQHAEQQARRSSACSSAA
ncbi:hypothetical protein G6F46_013992 [Rhizopus delemar]|nr:hypothetical protein G6F46_013992 [Rhizopus delemar]